MSAHRIYAYIYEDIVKDMSQGNDYSLANYIAKATYGKEAIAVDITQIPCMVNDLYKDGIFIRINSETNIKETINPIPTEEQRVTILELENETLTLALAEILVGV